MAKAPATRGRNQLRCPLCFVTKGRKNKITCGPPHEVYMFSHYQHSSDSDENVLDGHKKKTRTTTKTPAATTQPTTSEQCFEHVIETRSYQLNADTPIFNASRTAPVMTTSDPCSLYVSPCMRLVRFIHTGILFVVASQHSPESDDHLHAYI